MRLRNKLIIIYAAIGCTSFLVADLLPIFKKTMITGSYWDIYTSQRVPIYEDAPMTATQLAAYFTANWMLYAILLTIYFTPAIIALIRSHKNTIAIFCIDLFSGWTLLGWLTAMVMAVWKKETVYKDENKSESVISTSVSKIAVDENEPEHKYDFWNPAPWSKRSDDSKMVIILALGIWGFILIWFAITDSPTFLFLLVEGIGIAITITYTLISAYRRRKKGKK